MPNNNEMPELLPCPFERGQKVNIIVPSTFLCLYPDQEDLGLFEEYDGKIVVRRLCWVQHRADKAAESVSDDVAVSKFAGVMKDKLAQKRSEGRSGWENMTAEQLSSMLADHVSKGDPVDVANFCMMLWNNGHSISHPHQAESVENE